MKSISILHLITLLCCSSTILAEPVVLRSSVIPDEAWVGQKTALLVDVLVADGWAQIKKINAGEVENAYLLHMETQGTRLSETIDGVAYTGQRYEVMLFATKGGVINIPPIPVEVEVKTWGTDGESKVLQMQTPATKLDAKLPPGVENYQNLVSTTDLIASQSWEPETKELTVGGAIKRVINLQADDLPGMAFRPIGFADIPGVGIYPNEPSVTNEFGRGSLKGSRVESVSYIFEQSGNVEIPAIEVVWWDVENEELKRAELPGREINIAISAATTTGKQSPDSVTTRTVQWPLLIALLIIFGVLLFYRSRILEYLTNWKKERQETESAYFSRIMKSVRSGDARAVLLDTMRWLDRINTDREPLQLASFIKRFGDEQAKQVADSFLQHFHDTNSNVAAFGNALKCARSNWKKTQRQKKQQQNVLPELNSVD